MAASNLLEELCRIDHLLLAWKNLNKTNPGSYGLTGESLAEYGSNLESNLKNLSKKLKSGSFKFSPTRPYLIAKDNGKFRPLQIPEITDRVVLKGLALILERELKEMLAPGDGVSFAYQNGLGIRDALFKIKEYFHSGDLFIYEADIIDFFGTVNRESLLTSVYKELPDPTLNELIKHGITPNVGGLDQIPKNQKSLFNDKGGIPQGNALSPLFSNIYLSPFDALMKKNGRHLVRYADDFVIMSPSVEAAKKAHSESSTFLQDYLGLKVHALSQDENSKTRIVNPKRDVFSFLSVSFDGVNLFPSVKKKNEFLENIFSLCSTKQDHNVLTTLIRVKNSHDGWISTYIFTDIQRYFEEIDRVINSAIYRYLKSAGWKFQKKTLGKLPNRFRKRHNNYIESGECLSTEQRVSSGIPFSDEVFKLRKVKKELPNNKALRENGAQAKIV